MAKSAATTKKGKAKTETKKKQNGASKAKVVDLEKDDIADEDEEEDEEFVEKKNGNHQNGDGKENKEPTSETHSHSLLADCEKHFGNKDLYSILNVDKKTASDSDSESNLYTPTNNL